ncbi:nitrogen PTS system EIIA component [Gammaproteobacteria bacterium]
MDITEFLKPERIVTGARASSKRRVLELLAELLAKDNQGFDSCQILEGLFERECLGGTGLGNGIALPHSRIKGGERIVGAFLQLAQGISFEAIDNEKVDLFFALLVPDQASNEYLLIISRLARMFSDPQFRQRLRKTRDADAIHELIITTWQGNE